MEYLTYLTIYYYVFMTSVLNRSVYDSLINENGFLEQFLSFFLLSLSL